MRSGHLNRHGIAPSVVILCLVMLLAACGTATHTSERQDVTTTTVKLVKESNAAMTVLVDSVPMTLDGHLQVGGNYASKMIYSLIWPSPFVVMPGNVPQLDTLVVSSAVVTRLDPETVVYTINPSAVWSNGQPITAEDFIQLWHSVIRSSGWRPDIGYRDIASISGDPGGKTVTVVFAKPYGGWSGLFDNLLPVDLYPPTAGASQSGVGAGAGAGAGTSQTGSGASTESNPNTNAGQVSLPGAPDLSISQEFPSLSSDLLASQSHPLISGGPFQVVEFIPGQKIVLDSNPHWWGPPPNVSKIIIEGLGSDATSTLQSSSYDLAYLGNFDQNSLAQVTTQGNVTSMVKQGPEEMQMLFNLGSGQLTGSLPFRDGLAKIINRPYLVSQVIDPILPGSLPAGNYLYANSQAGYVSDSTGYNHPHLKDAYSLFQALGMKMTPLGLPGEGTWTLNGSPVVLSIAWNVNDPWANQAGVLIASQLYSAGFEVRTLPVTEPVFDNSILPSGSYSMALMPVETGPFPSRMEGMYVPLSKSSPFASSRGGTLPLVYGNGDRIDVNDFYDPAVSVLFSHAEIHMNPMRSAPVYQQVDMLLWHDMPALPLFSIPVMTVYRNWITGISNDADGPGPFFDLAEWQIFGVQPGKITAGKHS